MRAIHGSAVRYPADAAATLAEAATATGTTTRPSSVNSAAATPPNGLSPARREALARLRALAADRPVTLLTATKDLDLSQVAVLAGLLREAV